MGFSRQEHWSGLPCPPPGDLSNPEFIPILYRICQCPILAGRFFATWATFGVLLAWQTPRTEEPGRLQSMGEESDTTERLHSHFSLSCIGEGNGNPLQYSCLENPRDGGAWWAAVYGVAQSRIRLKRLSSSSVLAGLYAWHCVDFSLKCSCPWEVQPSVEDKLKNNDSFTIRKTNAEKKEFIFTHSLHISYTWKNNNLFDWSDTVIHCTSYRCMEFLKTVWVLCLLIK